LRALLDAVVDDPARNTRGWLLAEARRLASPDSSSAETN
jgi:hypothetical protein